MSVSATTSLVAPTPNGNSNLTRRWANFHPNIWGDHFIQYVSKPMEVDEIMKKISMLKEKVRKMLVPMNEKATTPLRKANLIESIQRLGLYYHFEREIEEVLQHIHNSYVENGIITLIEDLQSVALVFRLLRQQGYHILPDSFKKFKNEQGNFSETLIADVEGMLSLYEAAHLRIHGENILDEALVFTSLNLESMTTQLNPSLAAKVKYNLKRPLLKNLPRLVARHYISTYEEDPSHDATLLLLAKLDFNVLQKQYQKEAGNISKWWNDLDFATELPFARNRIIEGYFWILGVYFEPQYSLGRTLVTKLVTMATVIDDIYDVYGTFEELLLFTEAIERWDISCIDSLPEYMKVCYKTLFDLYEEVEKEMVKEGRAFVVDYVKNEVIRFVQANLAEAKWFNSNYIPTMEEYMNVSLVTVGSHMIATTSFMGMGHVATEKTFQWFEQKRGHVASALECYMNQHGVSRQDAVNELLRQVENAWKDINEELLDPVEVPKPLLVRILNSSRMTDVLYKDGDDSYTHPEGLKNDITTILVNPCPV